MARERGFAGMSEEEQQRIANAGGRTRGGNLANDPERAREEAQQNATNQGREPQARRGQSNRNNEQL